MKHSTIALISLEQRLTEGKSAHIGEPGREHDWPLACQKSQVSQWRSQGYTYAPPCDHVLPDGRCAGHEETP